MSDEKKTADSEAFSDDGFFDSLVGDFKEQDSFEPTEGEESAPKCMRDFSRFFEDAAAFGSGFESTIDKPVSELADTKKEETISFVSNEGEDAAKQRELITTPVTDEDGMIVIFDEEAGIDATNAPEQDAAKKPDIPHMILGEEPDTADIPKSSEEHELIFTEVKEPSDEDKFAADSNIPADDGRDNDSKDDSAENEGGEVRRGGLFPRKGDSVGEVIRKTVFLVSSAVFVGAAIMLVSTLIQSRQAVQELEDIKESVTTTVATSVNEEGETVTVPPTTEERREHNESLMDSFIEISGNVKGFIELPACDIYYPVVQGTDNSYYLTHTYDDRRNKAGSVFMDYRCTLSEEYTSPNIVLYGHNQEDGTMFGNLKYYKNNVDFYKNNPSVVFNTEYDIGDYVIFGYFITNVYDYQSSDGEVFHYHDYIETLSDEATFDWYMGEVEERNQIISPVDVVYGDKLLVLSTCSNEYSDSRFVVMARKLREGESFSDFDFSSARLNPYARQIDWSAILSEESVTEETELTVSEVTETSEETTVSETETVTVTETLPPETSATTVHSTKSQDEVRSELGLAPIYENGTTASIYSEPETDISTEEAVEDETTRTSPAGPVLAPQITEIH